MASKRPYIVSLTDFITKGNLRVGYKSTTPVGIDIGIGRTVNEQAFLNFHTLIDTAEYEARIVRNTGANGSFLMSNTGTGDLTIQQQGLGAVKVQTNLLDRFAVNSDGTIRVVNSAFAEIYFGSSLTGPGAVALSVDVANSALRVFTDGTEKVQVSRAGSLISHANASQEKVKLIGAAGAGASYVGFYTEGGSTAVGYIGTAKGLNASGAATNMALRFETFLQFLGTNAEWGRFTNAGTLSIGTTATGGQLYVRSASTTREAMRLEAAAGTAATQRVSSIWHPASSGTNSFMEFLTESTATSRGTVSFNRLFNVVNFGSACDQRLKENIIDAPSQGSLIDAMRVRQFNMKGNPGSTQPGFVAQELYAIAPIAVVKGNDNPALTGNQGEIWMVDSSKLVPILVKEIQDLRAREKISDAKIASLETQMANALARIVALERKGLLWGIFG